MIAVRSPATVGQSSGRAGDSCCAVRARCFAMRALSIVWLAHGAAGCTVRAAAVTCFTVPGRDVPINRVVADVELTTREPPVVRRAVAIEDARERRRPLEV